MEDDSSADESSSEATNTKVAGPIGASARVVNANGIGDLTDTEGDDFTVVARKKKVASIVIDASQNTTGLLTTLIKKMRSHTFEMADNKQLKAVIRGLPTDYDQKEIASELKGFGPQETQLTQGVNLKYTIKTMQNFLVKLEKWLTDWRIAINVEKTQAIVFRKWGVIDPQTELTLFDDNIQWVPVVCYLGLYIDSRLTYKKHIDYPSDKFWGRIALAISLIGRSSPLSLENKVILYKQILRPTIT
ncbi:RNA-directed DNA polymerase from mobile element jockey, partial [Trichonephila clavipes]